MKLFLHLSLVLFYFTSQGQQFSKSAGITSFSGIVITEIMADPDPPAGLPNAEYCEIFNSGTLPVNLAGWTFYDGSIRNLPAQTLQPGNFLIICDDDDTSLFPQGNFAAVSSISLTNSGEKISVRDATGFPIDSVEYSDSWYGDSFKKDGGWSLEKIDPLFPCQIPANWKVSENSSGGTPGIVNSVNGTIQDNYPPLLLRGYCPDSYTISLVFNEPVYGTNADILQNIQLSFPYEPTFITIESADPSRIHIHTNNPIDTGYVGMVRITGISDCAGNVIADTAATLFGLTKPESCRKAIINEILFYPREGGEDFIELYNNGNEIINICDLMIGQFDIGTGIMEQALSICDENYLLFPGDYIVITESSSRVAQQYKSTYPYKFLETENMPSMNIDEGYISLVYQGTLFDSLHYSDNFHFELLEDTKGVSLERIRPDYPSNNSLSWHSAAATSGFATPGLKNSQYYADVVKEKKVNLFPELFSPDMDGKDDFISISVKPESQGYIANIWIYNSSGQVIFENAKNSLMGNDAVFTWDGITQTGEIASPGIYVALVSLFNEDGNNEKYRIPFVLAIKL